MASIAHRTVSQLLKGNGLVRGVAPRRIPPATNEPKLVPARTGSSPMNRPKECVEVSPDVLALISANIANFFGREVRILGVRKLEPVRPVVDQWAGQGRIAVHTSHNLVQRGH